MGKLIYLHDANNGTAVTGKIMNSGDDVRGVEECLGMGGKEHKQTHEINMGFMNNSSHGQPHEEIT